MPVTIQQLTQAVDEFIQGENDTLAELVDQLVAENNTRQQIVTQVEAAVLASPEIRNIAITRAQQLADEQDDELPDINDIPVSIYRRMIAEETRVITNFATRRIPATENQTQQENTKRTRLNRT